jgi:hypothetical protein
VRRQENNSNYFFAKLPAEQNIRAIRELNFAALEDVVFFLQGAASTAQAAYQQDGYSDRHDQRDEASAYKNPM